MKVGKLQLYHSLGVGGGGGGADERVSVTLIDIGQVIKNYMHPPPHLSVNCYALANIFWLYFQIVPR